MALIVKAKLGDDLRRVTVQRKTEIGQLRGTLCHLFSVDPSQTLKLRYVDEEGDLITLTSQVELDEAFASLAQGASLRLELELAPLPSSSSSSSSSAPVFTAPITPFSIPAEPSFYPSAAFPSSSLPSSVSTSTSTSTSTPLFEEPPAEPEVAEVAEVEMPEGKGKDKEAAPAQEEGLEAEPLPAYRDEGVSAPAEKRGGDFFSNVYQEDRGLDFGYLLNEFHYHRLVIQTACRAGFDSLVKEYEEHHKAKVQEMWSRASVQSAVLANTIEKTFSEWKRDVSEYPPAQDLSNRVSEALKEVETFTTPIIESIRVALLHTLERIFTERAPASLTSSELVREMETFNFTSSPLPAGPADEPKVIPSDIHTHEEAITGTVGGASVVATPAEEVQVASSLSGEFIYVPEEPEQDQGEQEEQGPAFPFPEALAEILSMGFTDLASVKQALVAYNGEVNAAVNALL